MEIGMKNRIDNRVLVCGSEGSLMSSIIPTLAGENFDVLGVDSCERYGKRGRAYNPQLSDEHQSYQFVQLDLCDAQATRTLIESFRPNWIIQGAAKIYGVGGFNENCADILGDDIALHRNVLSAAVEVGVQNVHFISSSMVYERVTGNRPVKEVDSLLYNELPFTDYGLSKITNERLSQSYNRQYGLNYTIWRPFNIITPYEEAGKMGDSHVFADFIKSLVWEDNPMLKIYGDGEQVRCFTWHQDVANVIAKNINNKNIHNVTMNVGGIEPINMKNLAVMIRKIGHELGICSNDQVILDFRPAYPNDVQFRQPDITEIQDILGWQPTLNVEECVRKCLEVTKCKMSWKKIKDNGPEWKKRDKAYVKQMEFGA